MRSGTRSEHQRDLVPRSFDAAASKNKLRPSPFRRTRRNAVYAMGNKGARQQTRRAEHRTAIQEKEPSEGAVGARRGFSCFRTVTTVTISDISRNCNHDS